MRIWKYPLQVTDRLAITIPPGAKFLTVQMQGGSPCLWALVDETKKDTETRTIAIYGTWHPIPEDPGIYIDTFQGYDDGLVFHVFELRNFTVKDVQA